MLATGQKWSDSGTWSGRLALQVSAEPPTSLHAAFELEGSATQGRLRLVGPLGQQFADLRWQPGDVTLVTPSETRRYDSLDDLALANGDAPLPLQALFDWLGGRASEAPGWTVDLSRLSDGRLQARRVTPEPVVELRLVLDRP